MFQFLYIFLIMLICGFSPVPHSEPKKSSNPQVVIIGSGVGALTSAIYLQRAGIDTLVIEGNNPGGAIAQSPKVHNWPGEIEINGQDLINKIRKQAEVNGAKIESKEAIGMDFSGGLVSIKVRDVYEPEKVTTLSAKACIIAMGSKPKLLGIPGESGDKGYWTKGVYTCAVCDGALYKNKTVAVIGGGDSAVLEADYLSKLAKKVYIILRSDQFRTVETLRKNELLKKGNVEVLYNTKVQQIEGNGQKVTHLNLSSSKELPVDGVFVAIGANPNTEILKGKIDLDPHGYIKLVHQQQTSAPGVFAIGDVVDPLYKQAISAAGDGAKAALQVEHYLASLPAEKKESNPLQEFKAIQANNNGSENVVDIQNRNEFFEAIAAGTTSLVVEFYSPLCGPCKELSPKIVEMAKTYAGQIRFIKVNVAEHSDLASSYNIYGIPTILVFNPSGKIIEKASGSKEIEGLLKKMGSFASLPVNKETASSP